MAKTIDEFLGPRYKGRYESYRDDPEYNVLDDENAGFWDRAKGQFKEVSENVGDQLSSAGTGFWEGLKDAGSATSKGVSDMADWADENPQAAFEILGGLEDSIMAGARNKRRAADVLAANFGLSGRIGQDDAPSALDRLGRYTISKKIDAKEAAKEKAQKEFNDRYLAILKARAGKL